jgi:hypothetical protein
MLSVPERVPANVGVKVTPMVHVSPAPTLGPQVLLATAKSPLAVGVDTTREVLRWFVSVTVLATLMVRMA